MGELVVAFRFADRSGPRSRLVVRGAGNEHDWRRIAEGGSSVRLLEIGWERGAGLRKSEIVEQWDPDSLRAYCEACGRFGESYFHFCEWNGTRDCLEAWTRSRGETFAGLAEAGEYIAGEYFGVPDGVMRYMDAVRLASDVESGNGPPEIADRVSLCRLSNGDVEVREISLTQDARSSQCMTG